MKKILALALMALAITGAQAHERDGDGRWGGEGRWHGGHEIRGGWGFGPALVAGILGGVLVQQSMAYAPPPVVMPPPAVLPPPYPYGYGYAYGYPRGYGYVPAPAYGRPIVRHHRDDDDE